MVEITIPADALYQHLLLTAEKSDSGAGVENRRAPAAPSASRAARGRQSPQ